MIGPEQSGHIGCPQGVRERSEMDPDGREWSEGISAAHDHTEGLSSGFESIHGFRVH